MVTGPAAVLWDMDGTLVDSEKVWTVSLQDTARALGGELSAAARSAVVGSDMPRTLSCCSTTSGCRRSRPRMAEAERLLTARTAELFDAGLEWRPGALEALRTVRAAGWPTALVTNTGRALTERALDVIGREHFQVTCAATRCPPASPIRIPTCGRPTCSGCRPRTAWPWRTRRPGRWPPSGPGPGCWWCPATNRCPAARARILRDSLTGLTLADFATCLRAGARRACA